METFISNSVVHVTTDNKEPQKLTSEENFLLAHQVQPLFDEKVAFPQLMELKLSRLHKVQHLWKANDESNKAFANLGSLEISECSWRRSERLHCLRENELLDTSLFAKPNKLLFG
ncbi:hypothetical protein AB3S75_015424 [Citrus x aurantiifolia]